MLSCVASQSRSELRIAYALVSCVVYMVTRIKGYAYFCAERCLALVECIVYMVTSIMVIDFRVENCLALVECVLSALPQEWF